MSKEILDENKIYVFKNCCFKYLDYEVSEETFEGMSEERKKHLENIFFMKF